MAHPAQTATPKRKRGVEFACAPITFTFDLATAREPPEDGSNSPRSSVAHKFRGLMLGGGGGGGGGGGVTGDSEDIDMDAEGSMRKRQKPDDAMHDALQPETGPEMRPDREPQPESQQTEPETAAWSQMRGDLVLLPSSEGSPQRVYPAINRPSEAKSRLKKRAGTPPLRLKKRQPQEGLFDADDEADVVDPVRAALTWHEDEITIYDPDDEDDDGTGINGIGFKPTPAMAHARLMKRRQQMADYRKREESEARAKRSQRRRGEAVASARRSSKSPHSRRVRFMEAERRGIASNIAVTTR